MATERVLFLHPGAELYGSDRMAVASVAALVRAGMTVTVVVPESGLLVAEFEAAGADVTVSAYPVLRKALMRPKALFGLVVSLPRVIARAIRLIRETETDLVYVNTITQPWFIAAARLARRPVVAHVRESESEVRDLVKRALLVPLAAATWVVCNSRSTENYVLQHGTRVAGRTSVLYNGKDWSRYFESAFAGFPDTIVVGFVGRISPRKGIDLAVEALARIVATGVDAKLVIAGSVFPGYEWYAEQLEQRAAELGITSRVEFRGFIVDTARVLAESHIVVVPSLVEPFGTVAAESMAAERPTIVADVQGLVEIVDSVDVGVTFPVGDAAALADACLALIHDPARARSIAVAGRASVRERFSLDSYDRQTVDIARRLTGSTR